MDRIQPIDLVIFLLLLMMFVVGYAQGVVRRLLGIAAILFSLILGAQLRQPLGAYLTAQWTTIVPSYSYMIAFGAIFLAGAITLSLGIQISYRPAPLFPKYPVLDELLGGILGVIEGFLILTAIFLITDPSVRDTIGIGEFGPLRSLWNLLDNSLTASIMRDDVVKWFLVVLGFLFPQDVRGAFSNAIVALLARV